MQSLARSHQVELGNVASSIHGGSEAQNTGTELAGDEPPLCSLWDHRQE